MEFIFLIIIVISIVLMIFTSPDLILPSMQNGAQKAVELSINLVAIYALWLGILEIVDKTGLSKIIAKIIKPITKLLFKFDNEESENLVSINIASNILGMGNASTPSGIMAMEKFDKKDGKMNKNTIMLLILNSVSIQIIPSTIIGLRINFDSTNPTSIFLPNLLASFLTTFIVVCIALIIEKIKEKRKK